MGCPSLWLTPRSYRLRPVGLLLTAGGDKHQEQETHAMEIHPPLLISYIQTEFDQDQSIEGHQKGRFREFGGPKVDFRAGGGDGGLQ